MTANDLCPPSVRRALCHEIYGQEYGDRMFAREKFWNDARDRAAFIHATGAFPSHLRPEASRLLVNITRRGQSALDGRCGVMRLHDYVVRDLQIEAHPMIRLTRQKLGEGYRIEPTRGYAMRRNYWKVFMYKLNADHQRYGRITVQGDGSIKQGW